MLDARTEKTLSQFTDEVRRLLGENLVAIVLYGSGAGEDFVAGTSDLNVALVVTTLRFDVLQALQPRVATWRQQGFALPLLMDQESLSRSRDVFPMEFHDLIEQHRLLWGVDVFQGLTIDPHHLRFQAEYEARSKLLRVEALYLECAGDQRRLHLLMLDSLKTFLILMRALLRLRGKSGPVRYADVLAHFEQHFALGFPRLHELMAIRAGQRQWPAGAEADCFGEYLTEVQQLVGVIDRLLPDTPLP